MALPFIAGLALGALGVVAYKNRDIIKKKGENIFKDAKEKGEILKKDSLVSTWLETCAVAVNDTLISSKDIVLKDGDRISLLPPVCGG